MRRTNISLLISALALFPAAPPALALEFSLGGGYTIDGYYLSATDGSGFDLTSDNAGSDAFYAHTFQLLPSMKVNDKITVYSDIRLADDTVFGSDDLSTSDGGNIDINKVYMTIRSAAGLFRIGRAPAGTWYGDFLNTDTNGDRIMWAPPACPLDKSWSSLLYLEKVAEDDDLDITVDQDTDLYHFEVAHQGAHGLGAIGIDYTRNGSVKTEQADLQIFGDYRILEYNLQTEIHYAFGDSASDPAIDTDAWAAMVNVSRSWNDLTCGLLWFHASGDDESSASDNEAYFDSSGGLGEDFVPLLILTGYNGGILNEHVGSTSVSDDGVTGLVAQFSYRFTPKLTLHAAIGYAEVDEEPAGSENDLGWEFNLGLSCELLDNLLYDVHFGVLNTGDYFRSGSDDAEDVVLLSHHLSMEF